MSRCYSYDACAAVITSCSHHWQHPATAHDSATLGGFSFHGDPSVLSQNDGDDGLARADLLVELVTLEQKALGDHKHGKDSPMPTYPLTLPGGVRVRLTAAQWTFLCAIVGVLARRPRLRTWLLFDLFPAAPAWAKQQRQLATLLRKGVVERAPTGYRLAAGVRAQVQGGTPTDPCWSCRQDRADTPPLAPCPHCGAEATPL